MVSTVRIFFMLQKFGSLKKNGDICSIKQENT